MVCNQSTIAGAISKEVERLKDINKLYTAGKTETETRSVNASTVGEKRIKDQSKVRNKTAETISRSAFHAARKTQVIPNLQALYCLFFFAGLCSFSDDDKSRHSCSLAKPYST